jgi:hypothetical protein
LRSQRGRDANDKRPADEIHTAKTPKIILLFLNFPFLSKHNPLLANIRGEPRFKALMERVKREWENFEV